MPADDRTCLNLTAAQKAELEALGWTTLSSGHLTEAECLAACARPSWYCVTEYLVSPYECIACESSPRYWLIPTIPYFDPSTTPPGNEFNGPFKLQSVGGCLWTDSFTVQGPQYVYGYGWTLKYWNSGVFAANPIWTLVLYNISTGHDHVQYTIDGDEWDCFGPNTMTKFGSLSGGYYWPETLTLYAD